MGQRGKHTLPKETLKRRGTYRKDRHGAGQLPVEIPAMPPDMSPGAQATWKQVTEQLELAGLVSTIDGRALRLLCESWSCYIEANDHVREHGGVVTRVDRAGIPYMVKNPAVSNRAIFWKEVVDLLRQFGCTPSSRSGMDVSSPDEEDSDRMSQILGFEVA